MCTVLVTTTISSDAERSRIRNGAATVMKYDNEGQIILVGQTMYKHMCNVLSDLSVNFDQDTPEVTGNDIRVFLAFQGCSAVTCAVHRRQESCEFTSKLTPYTIATKSPVSSPAS